MLAFLQRLARSRQRDLPRVVTDSGGFAVNFSDGTSISVRWPDVLAVLAYKRDLLTTDEVILAFCYQSDAERVLEVSEEWPGFPDLFGPLESELGIHDSWYLETVRRAFDRDVRTLFDRRAVSPEVTR
jgi:hypothetical protein